MTKRDKSQEEKRSVRFPYWESMKMRKRTLTKLYP
jgi:hypothetical protein